MPKLLRRILAIRALYAVLLPFVMLALLGMLVLKPQLERDIEARHDTLATAVAAHIESFLSGSTTTIIDIATLIETTKVSAPVIQQVLDAHIRDDSQIETIYIVGAGGRLEQIGSRMSAGRKHDLIGIDMSPNPLLKEVRSRRNPIWSDAFLSIVQGHVSVGIAMQAGSKFVVGEARIDRLSAFLRDISTQRSLVVMIVDRNGQIIADSSDEYTSQKLNIGNMDIVAKGIRDRVTATGRFRFSGDEYIGTIVPVNTLGWSVLVAEPVETAFMTRKAVLIIGFTGLMVALASSLVLSIYMARRLASQVEYMAAATREIARDPWRPVELKDSNVTEFAELESDILHMSEAIRKYEQRYRELVESTPDLFVRASVDGAILYVNGASRQALGAEPDCCTKRGIGDFVHGDDRGRLRQAMDDWKGSSRSDFTFECRVIDMQGIERDMLWTVHLLRDAGSVAKEFFFIIRDITNLKNVEKELRRREEDLRMTLLSIGDGVIVTDAAGRIVRMNPAAEQMAGRYLAGSEGRSVETLLPALREAKTPVVDLTVAGQGNFTVSVSKAAITGSDGRERGTIFILRDITEQVHTEEQLRHAQKMESIGQLAGGVAHDFNNMLAAIMGSAQIVEFHANGNATLLEQAEMITNVATKAAGLTRQLLAFSRKMPLQSSCIDVRAVIDDTVAMVKHAVDRRIHVDVMPNAGMLHVYGDEAQLQNSLLNLCLNARDAMPDGGRITLSAQSVELDEAFCTRSDFTLTPGPFVKMEVSDTGVGMTEAIARRIFEPFFTTKAVGKGTGLGLAAVYGFVCTHGGAIFVRSTPGAGSTFTIYLPQVSSEDCAQREKKGAEPVPQQKAMTILVVEDDAQLRTIVERLLKGLGHHVLLASDGREGIELFTARHDTIDLVFLDIVMPDINGVDVFKAMKEIDGGMRAIFSSGFTADTSLGDIGGDPSCLGFIQKPYRLTALADMIARAGCRTP